jgi:hypothetical protein
MASCTILFVTASIDFCDVCQNFLTSFFLLRDTFAWDKTVMDLLVNLIYRNKRNTCPPFG